MRKYRKKRKVIFISIVLAITTLFFLYNAMQRIFKVTILTNQERLKEIAENNVTSLMQKLDTDSIVMKGIAAQLAMMDDIKSQEAISFIHTMNEQIGFVRIGIDLLNGDSYTSDFKKVNVNDLGYLPSIMKGEVVITDILEAKIDKANVFAIIVPIYKNKKVIGGVRSVYLADGLSKALDDVSFNGTGYFNIINSKGRFLYKSEEAKKLSNDENIQALLQKATFQQGDAITFTNDMKQGKRNFMSYTYQGKESYIYYMPVGLHDWYIMSALPKQYVDAMYEKVEYEMMLLIVEMGAVISMFLLALIYNFQKSKKDAEGSNKYLSDVLNHIPVAVSIVDQDQKLTFLNTVGVDLMKHSLAEEIGKTWSLWDRRFPPLRGTKIYKEEHNENTSTFEIDNAHYLVNSATLYDLHHKENGHIEIYQDITTMMQTQQELSALSNNIPGGVLKCATNEASTILFMSDGFLEMVGYTRDEIKHLFHDSLQELIAADDEAMVMKEIQTALQEDTQITLKLQYRLKTKANQMLWVMHHGEYVSEIGQENAFYCVLIDVTAQVHAQIALQEKTVELESISENMDGGILITKNDEEFTILYINSGHLKLYGYEKEELMQQVENKALRIIHPYDVASMMKTVKQQLAQGDVIALVHRILRKDGKVIWISTKGKRIYEQNGSEKIIWVSLDITDIKIKEEEIRINEERYRIATQNAQSIVFDYQIEDGTLSHSPKLVEEYGVDEHMLNVPNSIIDLGIIHKDSIRSFIKCFQQVKYGKEQAETEIKTYNKQHDLVWMRMILTTIYNDEHLPVRAIGMLQNITEQKVAESSAERELSFKEAMLNDTVAFYEINLSENRFIQGHDLWIQEFQLSKDATYEEVMHQIMINYVEPQDHEAFNEIMDTQFLINQFHQGLLKHSFEYRRLNPKGNYLWVNCNMYMLKDKESGDVKCISYIKDIQKDKEQEFHLKQQAQMDLLSGLYNKVTAQQEIANYLQKQEQKIEMSAFFIIDIDDFKEVNDTLGHAVGDAFLIEIAQVLCTIFRSDDIIGRIGGDEFCVFMKEVPSTYIIERKAQETCENIRANLTTLQGKMQSSCSIGIAIAPMDGEDFESLYRKADTALYYAKQHGKNSFWRYGCDS